MKQRFLSFFSLLILLCSVSNHALAQCTYTTTGDGNFGSAGIFAVTTAPCTSAFSTSGTTYTVTAGTTLIINNRIALNGDLVIGNNATVIITANGSLIEDGTARTLTVEGGTLTINAVTSRTVPRLNVSILILSNTTSNRGNSVTVGANSAIQIGCLYFLNQAGITLGNNALLNVSRDVTLTNGNASIVAPTTGVPAGIRVGGNFRGTNGGSQNIISGLLTTCFQANPAVVGCSSASNSGINEGAAPAGNIGTPTGGSTTNDPTCRSVLPVTLTSFTASRQSSNVYVKWVTATEKNNAYFEVQRSNDGKNFTAVGKVTGNGTTATGASYSITDRNPLAATSYYRLRQVDNDATESFSSVVAVSGTDKIEASFYPNPSNNTVTLPAVSGLVKYRVYTATGQSVAAGEAQGGSEINIQKVPTGIYFLELISADKHNVQRFVKQ